MGRSNPQPTTNREYPGELRRPATPSPLSPGALVRPGDEVRLLQAVAKFAACAICLTDATAGLLASHHLNPARLSVTEPVTELPLLPATASPLERARALLKVGPGETRPLALSFVYSFAVLAAYYVLRSVRDEMGVQLGKDMQAWLYSVVFLLMLAAVPLFGWIVSKFPRRQLVTILHGFFIVNLLAFWGLFHAGPPKQALLAAFYIWVSTFNVFIVSLFWSTMSSMWTSDQAKRLYGVIAAGATAGVFCGPVLTNLLVGRIGQTNLLLVSAAFLGLGIAMARALTSEPLASGSASASTMVKSEAPTLAAILSGAVNVIRTPYLLQIAIDSGQPVAALEVTSGWLEIHAFDDYQMACRLVAR